MADNALSTPPSTPPPAAASSSTTAAAAPPTQTPVNIVTLYNKLLTTDANITPPIAAIESLISLLSKSNLQTVSETLSLLSTASATLLASCSNPLPVSAGTDLFQRYLITSFNQTPLSSQSGSDFTALRNQLITNSKLFVARTRQARSKIASHALPLFGPERDTDFQSTVITYGSSRVVDEILRHAADKGRWFHVIHVLPSTVTPASLFSSSNNATTTATPGAALDAGESSSLARIRNSIALLNKSNIASTAVPLSSLPLVLATLPTHPDTRSSRSTFFLLGTVAVLENGALVSELGSSLVAATAKQHGVPMHIASESYKFVRQFPLGCGEGELKRMGVKQNDVFTFSSPGPASAAHGHGHGHNEGSSEASGPGSGSSGQHTRTGLRSKEDELVDITEPGFIGSMVTENGVMTPDAVAEELIKLWF